MEPCKYKALHLVSNNICYGPAPEPTKEVE